jgi:hypothetical protein
LTCNYTLVQTAKGVRLPLNQGAIHFFEIENSTATKGLPHSEQRASSRDVINPHEGHILCA